MLLPYGYTTWEELCFRDWKNIHYTFFVAVHTLIFEFTGFCIITCRFAFPKTLYARIYMWLNVTECHWHLELQMASCASLRCFCCCNTNCYATIKTLLPPLGINWPLRFSSTGPEIPTTQCILFYRDDFKCVENLESWKITCTCKAIASISQVSRSKTGRLQWLSRGWLT
jgi:hypothetical protein